jgi:hypothetical protein
MSGMTEPVDWAEWSPMTAFRDWVAKSEAQWSQAVSDLMKNPRASGMLNRQIDEARMMQRMFAEFAQASLAMANLPSRSDVEGLDERMGRVENGLAALSAEVVRLREALGARASLPAPPRTRRPPPPAPKEADRDKTVRSDAETGRPRHVDGQRASKASTQVALSSSKGQARTAKRQKARPEPGRT